MNLYLSRDVARHRLRHVGSGTCWTINALRKSTRSISYMFTVAEKALNSEKACRFVFRETAVVLHQLLGKQLGHHRVANASSE